MAMLNNQMVPVTGSRLLKHFLIAKSKHKKTRNSIATVRLLEGMVYYIIYICLFSTGIVTLLSLFFLSLLLLFSFIMVIPFLLVLLLLCYYYCQCNCEYYGHQFVYVLFHLVLSSSRGLHLFCFWAKHWNGGMLIDSVGNH